MDSSLSKDSTPKSHFSAADVEEIVRYGEACHREIGCAGRFHPNHFRRSINHYLANPDSVLIVDEQKRGAICGVVFQDPFTADIVAQQIFWYVLPKHRGRFVSVRLMKQFEQWARQKKAVRIFMGSPQPFPFTRFGYKATEQYFQKIL